MNRILFLGYVVSSKTIHAAKQKIPAIRGWLTQSKLTTFYRQFKYFGSYTELLEEQRKIFEWTKTSAKNFKKIKQKLPSVLVLALRILRKFLRLNVIHVGLKLDGYFLKSTNRQHISVKNSMRPERSGQSMSKSYIQYSERLRIGNIIQSHQNL